MTMIATACAEPARPAASQGSASPAQAASACEPRVDYEVSPGAHFSDDRITAEQASAAPMPSDVRFDVTARIEGEQLIVDAVLRNDAAEPRRVVYLTGGVSGNPIGITPVLTLRPTPPAQQPPEIYPEPRAVDLEPGASVRYTFGFCLDAYEPPIPDTIDIDWRYSAWTEPRSGRVTAHR